MLKTQALLLESVSSMRLWRTLKLSRLEVLRACACGGYTSFSLFDSVSVCACDSNTLSSFKGVSSYACDTQALPISMCTGLFGVETHDRHRDRHTPSLFEAFNVPALYVAIWAVLMDPCDVVSHTGPSHEALRIRYFLRENVRYRNDKYDGHWPHLRSGDRVRLTSWSRTVSYCHLGRELFTEASRKRFAWGNSLLHQSEGIQ